MNQKTSKIAIVTLLALLMVPTVQAFTIDGPTNFQYGTGGNVRFGTFVSTQLSIVNALNQFNGLRYGGTNYGVLGFECADNVNMTILSVSTYKITYNVSTLAAGSVDTYVHYNRHDETPVGTNTDNVAYDLATDIATVTTTGNGVIVTLNYAGLTDNLISSFDPFIALFPIFMFLFALEAKKRDLINNKAMVYVMIIAAVALVIVAMRAAGF